MRPPFFILVVLAALITSCKLPIRFISSTHQYDVYIESGFSDEQRHSVVASFQEWERATQQTVTFVEVPDKDNNLQALIVVTPTTKQGLLKLDPSKQTIGKCYYWGASSHIYIATELDYRDFYQTSLHEFGHSVGLEHDLNMSHRYQTTMMSHTMDSTARVTCRDVNAFCDVWGCDASQFPVCKEKDHPSL